MKEGAKYFVFLWKMAEKHLIRNKDADIVDFWQIVEQFAREIATISLFSLFRDHFRGSRRMIQALAVKLREPLPATFEDTLERM